jgi:hypothetical protein
MFQHATTSRTTAQASDLRRRASAPGPRIQGPLRLIRSGCACGGTCPHCSGAAAAGPRLTVNEPGDAFEREADRVADQVMRMPDDSISIDASPPQVSRKCEACEREDEGKEALQLKPAGPAEATAGAAPPIVHEVLRSPGQPLDPATRAFMEPRFGHDFSQVRVHTDTKAAESARAVNALAYTVRGDIALASGQYKHETTEGRRLLAHELAHVVQQEGSVGHLAPASRTNASNAVGERVLRPKLEVSPAGNPFEREEADAAEDQALGERTPDPRGIQSEPEGGNHLTSPRFSGDPLLEACFDDRARMTQGHRGPSVEKVQQALLDLGYNLGPSGADGIYGQKTWDAVKEFKANEGLGFEHMGDVGPGTMHRLDELFGSKAAEESATRVAEESLDVCPSDKDIVTALEARPDQLSALVGSGSVGQPASAHVKIVDAVRLFQSKVNVTGLSSSENVSQTGQFFWVTRMHDAMQSELILLSSDPTALAFVAKARRAREAIAHRDFKTAQRLIGELDLMAQTTRSPSKPKMQSLLQANPLDPSRIETLLWNALNADPTNSMPSLAPFLSLRTLMQLEAFDSQSCGFAAGKIAERLRRRGGVTARPDPKAGLFSADLNTSGVCLRDRRHTPTAAAETMLGDVLKQTDVISAVAQLKKALDAGQLVHARVLSGVGIGTEKDVPFDSKPAVNVGQPPPEHSLVIIGFDDDKFVFSDPDANVSKSPETGFGFLFFDSSNGRLSTAENTSDLPVDPNGKHPNGNHSGDKRYQVLTLSTRIGDSK